VLHKDVAGGTARAARRSGTWSPDSWRLFPLEQAPEWPDESALKAALFELERLPPLIDPGESRRLLGALGQVASGRAIVLQAGDCAESFADVTAESIRDRLSLILQMAVVLAFGSGLPIVRVGRLAGQFAKPRSSRFERIGDKEMLSFRGDMVNDDAPDPAARVPDPSRMVRAYQYSAATLNQLRALSAGGFTSLSHVHAWNPGFVAETAEGRRYEETAEEIDRVLAFLPGAGATAAQSEAGTIYDYAEVFTSHEALLLDYEQALTRRDESGRYFDGSAHLLWIGDRTRQLGGAHIEFARGITNPLGVKIGPSVSPDETVVLCEVLNPERIPGRISLICRLGVTGVETLLPPIVEAVKESGHPVVWQCDPMHGNTFVSDGRKTRRFDDIVGEIRGFFTVHRQLGTWPGGIHVELTGGDVTECLGGIGDISEEHLPLRYTTACDPRLNARQALDLAFRVAEMLPG